MDKLLKEILKLVLEIKQISGHNNDLLGFLCSRSSLLPQGTQEDFISVLLFRNISPDEFGIS